MSLYLKHRPQSINDIAGNYEVKESLLSLLSKKEKPLVYLFTGDTGCGKTTFARAIGNYLSIDSKDISEINSSDMRGIDTVRSLSYGIVLIMSAALAILTPYNGRHYYGKLEWKLNRGRTWNEAWYMASCFQSSNLKFYFKENKFGPKMRLNETELDKWYELHQLAENTQCRTFYE